MEQSSRDPWPALIGATVASLAVIFLLTSCGLPDFDVDGLVPGGAASAAVPSGGSAGKADQPVAVDEGDPAPSGALAAAAEDAVDPDAETAAAVAFLNRVRAEVGLSPVHLDAAASVGAQWHADYLWENRDVESDLSAHEQDASLPGFTGVHYWERLEAAGVDLGASPALGEVIATHPRSVSAVQHWLETVYHRLPLLAPEAKAVGYGHTVGDGHATNVMDLVARPAAGPTDWPPVVLYPAPGAVAVRPWWDGLEWPRPPQPPGGFPSGPVISLSTLHGLAVEVHTHAIHGPDGARVPHVFLDADSDPNLARAGAVFLYPNAPLAPGARYTVRVAGAVDGVGFDETWSFETAADDLACRPGAGACGPGRACYHLTEPLTCEFEGILPARAPCRYANDCAAGTTCFRGACQAYCALDGGGALPACGAACAFGHLPLPVAETGLGLCLPPPCDPHADACGDGRWCTWGGAFVCDTPGRSAVGASCVSSDACVEGASCLDLGGGFRCHALCATAAVASSDLAACEQTCPGAARTIAADGTVGVCP